MGLGIYKDNSMTIYTIPLMGGEDKKWEDNTWLTEHLHQLAHKIKESRMKIISIGTITTNATSAIPELIVKGYEDYVEAFVVDKDKPLRAIDFNSMLHRTKWKLWKKVMDVKWVCNQCHTDNPEFIVEVQSAGFDSIECPWCGNVLTHRTNGGQNNPFNWTFVNK